MLEAIVIFFTLCSLITTNMIYVIKHLNQEEL
jgi:hypothetical protein